MRFDEFFRTATGHAPYPYQRQMALEPWPQVLDIPTGLGKTAAVVLAWAYRRYREALEAPRRRIYCLPMRVLVEQIHREAKTWCRKLAPHFEARAHQMGRTNG